MYVNRGQRVKPHPPTLGYHSNVESLTHVFEQHFFSSFHEKLPRTRRFFLISMESIPNGVCCRNLGLIFHSMASYGDNFRFAPFASLNDLKSNKLVTMATRMVSFDVYGQAAVKYRFPSDHRSQGPPSGVSTWMSDHPGTPRAVGKTRCTRQLATPRPQVGSVRQSHSQNTPQFTAKSVTGVWTWVKKN